MNSDSIPGSTSGRSDDATHVVTFAARSSGAKGPSENAVLDRATVEFGNADDSSSQQGLRGGGITVDAPTPGGLSNAAEDCSVVDVVVRECQAVHDGGGAQFAYVEGFRGLNITFENNRCYNIPNDGSGGGLFIRDSGNGSTFANCVIRDNVATYGGGLSVSRCDDTVNIVNTLVSDNFALAGGGVFSEWMGTSTGEYAFIYTTIANNTTRSDISASPAAGSGIYFDDTGSSSPPRIELRNSIVFANNTTYTNGTSPNSNELAGDVTTTTVALDYSCVNPGAAFVPIGGAPLPAYYGTGSISADPQFFNPVGGNFDLSTGSPCIDAASDVLLPPDLADVNRNGNTSEPLPQDIDPGKREKDMPEPNVGVDSSTNGVFGAISDMGAFERT